MECTKANATNRNTNISSLLVVGLQVLLLPLAVVVETLVGVEEEVEAVRHGDENDDGHPKNHDDAHHQL